jgi:hypothetical protein
VRELVEEASRRPREREALWQAFTERHDLGDVPCEGRRRYHRRGAFRAAIVDLGGALSSTRSGATALDGLEQEPWFQVVREAYIQGLPGWEEAPVGDLQRSLCERARAAAAVEPKLSEDASAAERVAWAYEKVDEEKWCGEAVSFRDPAGLYRDLVNAALRAAPR